MNETSPAPRTRAELRRYGPNLHEAALRVEAEAVTNDLTEQRERWRRGFTRRRVVAGIGAVGVASLATQLVTTRMAFADPATTKGTLVVVFLRGGVDGLSVVVPAGDPNLLQARPRIAVPASTLLPAGGGFGLHPALAPLRPFWTSGQMAAVHAVASPDASRSHFQAQDCLERGAASTSVHSGWLDRTLVALGPGTTFRAMALGSQVPRSLVGDQDEIALSGLADFRLAGWDQLHDKTVQAIGALYTGVDELLAGHAKVTLRALTDVRQLTSGGYQPGVDYPDGDFAAQLRDIARLVKANVGLRVATVDLGGWDMHTDIGTTADGDLKNHLAGLSAALAAFATDLGPALGDVTLVAMSEFGRRVAENANAGADHGHGGVMLLLGGGLNGGRVHGAWPGLAPSTLDHGDVAGANDYRDILGEALAARFGVGTLGEIFPGHQYRRLGVFR